MATRIRKSSGSSKPHARGKKDAISLLKEDHRTVQELLEKLTEASGRPSKMRESLLSKIDHEARTHMRVEEEIFYPAFKESVRKKEERKLYYEALEEHHVADLVMDELEERLENEPFAAKCSVLKEVINHHIKEEEGKMFPLAKKAMDAEMLQDLAERIEERKQQITSRLAA